MWKKLLILSLSMAVLFVFSAPISSVDAGGNWGKRNVNWRIAGTIVQNIDVTSPDPFFPNQDPVPHSLINVTAYGPPGPAKITFLSTTTLTPPPCVKDCFECADGFGNPVYFDKDDMIAMFPDQSLLFASIDVVKGGILCFSPIGTTYFKAQLNVTFGTGRFERVSGGVLIGEGNGYPVSLDSTLVGENGKLKGEIKFD